MTARIPSDETGARLLGGGSFRYLNGTLDVGTGIQAIPLPAGALNCRVKLNGAGKLYGAFETAGLPDGFGYEALEADTYNDVLGPCGNANYLLVAGDAGSEDYTVQLIMGAA